jgi:hypothetical protein
MKFSEQVVLGSTLIRFQPWCFLQEGCGCLIGMAGAALGETYLGGKQGAERIGELFPWLTKFRVVRCPYCFVTHYSFCETVSCVAWHVEQGEMTFDRALAYIQMIEPQEEPAPVEQKVAAWNRYWGVQV